MALAFYLINLQEFTIQTSLAVARDRVFGVLLGLMSMWLIFDRLWVKSALNEMQDLFAHNLEMFAELTEQLLVEDRNRATKRIRQLRDQLNAGFQAVVAQADAVLFEFGRSRRRQLEIRNEIRRWQPNLRTLLLVQLTGAQYTMQRPIKDLPPEIAEAKTAFEKDIAGVARVMADEVTGKIPAPVPDIPASAANVTRAMRKYYEDRDLPLPSHSADMIHIVDSLCSIIWPLYEDIHTTFAHAREQTGLQQTNQLPGLGEVQS